MTTTLIYSIYSRDRLLSLSKAWNTRGSTVPTQGHEPSKDEAHQPKKAEEGVHPEEPTSSTTSKKRSSIYIGALNVRKLATEDRLLELQLALDNIKMDILALTE